MFKGLCFTTGLCSGVYFGIYLRERGYHRGFSKAYHAFKGEETSEPLIQQQKTKRAPNYINHNKRYEQIFRDVSQGNLSDEDHNKFIEFIKSGNYENIDSINTNSDGEHLFNNKEFKEMKSKANLLGDDIYINTDKLK